MTRIDFLPRNYHEKSARKSRRLWLRCVVLLFGAAICAAAAGQFYQKQSVARQLAELDSPLASAHAQQKNVNRLRADRTSAREAAELAAYLQHPWPRTKILSELLVDLPKDTELQSVQLLRTEAVVTRQLAPQDAKTEAPTSGPKRDLEKLRVQCDASTLRCEIKGVTRNSGELHRYVSQLKQSPLVQSAALRSLETVQREEQASNTIRFTIDAQIVPAYGLPGGPIVPLKQATTGEKSAGGKA